MTMANDGMPPVGLRDLDDEAPEVRAKFVHDVMTVLYGRQEIVVLGEYRGPAAAEAALLAFSRGDCDA